ncbi:MAG: orotidine 5'-phosphate decarboxylase / HUMPS family protein [Candidatus Aminicenantia bacterium]
MKRRRGLIIGLEHRDIYHIEETIRSISKFDKSIVFKIKPYQMLDFLFTDFKTFENPIIYDTKLADVGDYINTEINRAINNKFAGIIVHGFMSNTVLQSIEKTKDSEVDVVVIADVTDKNSYYDKYYKEIAKDSAEFGANGIVAPATKPKRIKEIRKIIDEINDDIYILSPGIKYQGGSAKKALENGTDYLIVVRDIMEAKNPREKAEDYLDLISSYS